EAAVSDGFVHAQRAGKAADRWPVQVWDEYADKPLAVVPADRSRPDVAASKGMGSNSGWGAELWALPDGAHTVCAVALNVGGGADQNLGCRNVVVK
ncbi:MAG TPA: hypothetical protein PLY51_07005, partial [Microthrixaceae bacterium]|nr:hypothetical protein [Microthrixaceae bacterium]